MLQSISTKFHKLHPNISNTEDAIIEGYASKFNMIDKQNEIIRPNAFLFSHPKDVKLLWQHDYATPIGVIESLFQDNVGLYVVARIISDVQSGKEAISLINKHVLNGLSVGFESLEQDFNDLGQKNILTANLLEISVVTFPANHSALILDIQNESHYKKHSLPLYYSSLSKLENLLTENF